LAGAARGCEAGSDAGNEQAQNVDGGRRSGGRLSIAREHFFERGRHFGSLPPVEQPVAKTLHTSSAWGRPSNGFDRNLRVLSVGVARRGRGRGTTQARPRGAGSGRRGRRRRPAGGGWGGGAGGGARPGFVGAQ